MFKLKISDISPSGVLAFDLKDILEALGPEALGWSWIISSVEENGEELWTLGKGTPELEALRKSGMAISGLKLAEIAERIAQVIWGKFSAFRDNPSDDTWVRIVAFDGSCFEIWCEDKATLMRTGAAFKNTTLSPA